MNEPAPDPDDVQLGSRNAEIALLSACLESKGARVTARRHLTHDDFYWPDHALVYQAVNALDRAGRMIDTVTVREALVGYVKPAEVARISNLVVELLTAVAHPDHAGDHATIIRGYALRRRAASEGRRLVQRALSPSEDPSRLVTETVTRLQGLRDVGSDVTATSLKEIMAEPEPPPSWVIPELLERQDRLMLTGSEGAGKSALQRQLAVMSASGVHPFTEAVIPPIRTLIIDLENKHHQVRRQTVPLLRWLHERGADDPGERVFIDTPGRMNLLRDIDLSHVHQTMDAFQPDLVILGPIYKAVPGSINSDDEASAFLAAIDTITERDCAVILEAHAGHTKDGVGKAQQRDLRPRGSSQLMGWPEFGLGLRGLGHGLADLEPWRGGREDRAWPARMRRSPGNRWVETYPDDRPPYGAPAPAYEAPVAAPDPQASLV